MTALPAATAFTDAATTEAQFKTAITELRAYLAGLLGADGTPSTALATLQALFAAGVSPKAWAYTAVESDKGKILDCSGTWTLSLLAATTAGAGYTLAVKNSGSGVITIDPSGAELVDGAATLALAAGEMTILVCSGTGWWTAGGGGVSKDMGYGNVGSLCFASYSLSGPTANTTYVASGATVAGSTLLPASLATADYAGTTTGTALSGTWRCLGIIRTGSSVAAGTVRYVTLFQRIA